MDLSKVRARLDAYTPKQKQKYEKIDYSKVYFKPDLGKHVIRIVPSKFDASNPFKEVYFHYGFAKFPILALNNWNEKDPIVEFVKDLRKSKDPEDWALAKKLNPKQRIFIPVIVRGEESKGVRLWEVGALIHKQLLALADDADYGDYTSLTEGRDITIEVKEEFKFNKTIKTVASVLVKPKTSILSDNTELVEKWLNEQPDVLTLNKKNTYDFIEDILKKFLTPEDESTEEPVITSVSEDDDVPYHEDELEAKIPYKAPEKKSKADKFEELFDKKAK